MHDMSSSLSSASATRAQPATAALFISDLHLHAAMPRTTQAFLDFLRQHASQTRQLYLLGDVFEAWAGDDDIDDPYNRHIVDALRHLSGSGVQLFWMAGNRDFLVGAQFARASGVTLLPDPFVTTIAERPIVLTHGDAQCTDDESYMQFRAQVRQAGWQHDFLAMPLAQRKKIIESMRAESSAAQRGKAADIMDVNADAITALFKTTGVTTMIHGHTHRPACHDEPKDGVPHLRYVLSDWDLDSGIPRGDWLAIDLKGNITRLGLDAIDIAC